MYATDTVYFPGPHAKQPVAPGPGEYSCAGHCVHAEAPAEKENVPALQFKQLLDPREEYFPLVQAIQMLELIAARQVENVPAAHGRQVDAPASEYVPS